MNIEDMVFPSSDEFALKMIEFDDAPDNCWFCPFFGEAQHESFIMCNLLDEITHVVRPICSVTDFVKYLIENV